MFILWSHWTRKQDLDLTPYSTCGCAAFVSPPCAQMSGFWKQRWISGLHWGSFSVVGLSGCTAHANILVSSDSGWRPVDWSETSGVPVMSVSQADEEITDSSLCSCGGGGFQWPKSSCAKICESDVNYRVTQTRDHGHTTRLCGNSWAQRLDVSRDPDRCKYHPGVSGPKRSSVQMLESRF